MINGMRKFFTQSTSLKQALSIKPALFRINNMYGGEVSYKARTKKFIKKKIKMDTSRIILRNNVMDVIIIACI